MPSLLLPEQLNHLRHGGFCCRWGGWLPAAAAVRRQPQKKRRWGNLCLLSHTYPLACGGLAPPRKLLRCMAPSRCRRQATAAKKKGGGEICACFRTPTPLIAEEIPHPWHFDPLTVISPSPRKSPGAAGALSLSLDGVSDPAAASGSRASERSPDEGRGERSRPRE